MKRTLQKLTLLLGLFLLASNFIYAQNARGFYKTPYKNRNSGSFDRTSGLLSIGIGFPNRSGADFDFWGGNERRNGIGPLYFKYEHGLIDELGLGGYAAIAASRYKYGPDRRYTDRAVSLSAGFLAYYHFNKLIPVRKLDVYAGVGVGVRQLSYTYDDRLTENRDDDRTSFDAMPVVKVGARYYFNNVFGVYGEGGYDNMSDVNLGITVRF